MATYLMLIYGDPAKWAAMSDEEEQLLGEGHRKLCAIAGQQVLDTRELEPPEFATTLRADGSGGVLTTDGPFLETKEALGGFYLIEAADLDEVLALASNLQEASAGHSGVEIRPILSS